MHRRHIGKPESNRILEVSCGKTKRWTFCSSSLVLAVNEWDRGGERHYWAFVEFRIRWRSPIPLPCSNLGSLSGPEFTPLQSASTHCHPNVDSTHRTRTYLVECECFVSSANPSIDLFQATPCGNVEGYYQRAGKPQDHCDGTPWKAILLPILKCIYLPLVKLSS